MAKRTVEKVVKTYTPKMHLHERAAINSGVLQHSVAPPHQALHAHFTQHRQSRNPR